MRWIINFGLPDRSSATRLGIYGGFFLLFAVALIACGDKRPQVAIYASVDQVYAEPVLKAFEAQSGLKVQAVYDVEASKTTGLVNRLLAEMARPQADVYWSGEFAQTILLKQRGALAPYHSPTAQDIPSPFKDEEGYWTGFGGRARVFIVNRDHLSPEQAPKLLSDFLDPGYPAQKIGLAYPLFGTTATHAAALYALQGQESGREFFLALQQRGVNVVDGNALVKDRVANGDWWFGLTDTDDACQAIQRGAPVYVVFPDQEEGASGTLVIPNTVALIKGGPNPEQGRQLVDYLLSLEVETMLVEMGWVQFPLRPLGVTPQCYPDLNVRTMTVNLEQVYEQLETAQGELGEIFVR